MMPSSFKSSLFRPSTISPHPSSQTPSTEAEMVMNNIHMREILQCSDQELTDLKNAFKHQMETNYVNGEPFLGQLPSEVDPRGEIRELMWSAVMTSDRKFLAMLRGRRWGVKKPADFDTRLRQAKSKICSDLGNEKRRSQRQPKREREEDGTREISSEDSNAESPPTDRHMRKKPDISYDLQQMRVFGGNEPPGSSVASTPQPSKRLRPGPNMFSNVHMRPSSLVPLTPQAEGRLRPGPDMFSNAFMPLPAVQVGSEQQPMHGFRELPDEESLFIPEESVPCAREASVSYSQEPKYEDDDKAVKSTDLDGERILVSDLIADPRVLARAGRRAVSSPRIINRSAPGPVAQHDDGSMTTDLQAPIDADESSGDLEDFVAKQSTASPRSSVRRAPSDDSSEIIMEQPSKRRPRQAPYRRNDAIVSISAPPEFYDTEESDLDVASDLKTEPSITASPSRGATSTSGLTSRRGLRPPAQPKLASAIAGAAPSEDEDSDGSDIIVVAPSSFKPKLRTHTTITTHQVPTPTTDTAPPSEARHSTPPRRGSLVAMVTKIVRSQVAESEARILAHVDRKVAGAELKDKEVLKAEIREEVLEELGREFA